MKYLVEYRENMTNKPLPELRDYIFIGAYDADSPEGAAEKVEAVTGREGMAFRVTELLPDGQKTDRVYLVKLDSETETGTKNES